MKKILSTLLAMGMAVSLLAGCGSTSTAESSDTSAAAESTEAAEESTEETEAAEEPAADTAEEETEAASDVKIGVILVGDETEGYTKAHIDGITTAGQNVGLADSNILWKYNVPESDDCYAAAKELVANGCTLIISNSYGHQDYMAEAAEEFPDVSFVAMTGDYAAISGLDNFYNAFTDVYESRYVSGVVAGMKIAELAEADLIPESGYDADHNVKIGYVGAFPYAEVVSGYTAFFLGIKSVYPDVSMEVTYTNSWFDIEAEGAAAESLMADGCVVIGQHADSTGAPTAVQTAQDKNGAVVYSVG
ncbi:MAG TPA: BMP family ABC transporter substrate-binding protein, partial [Lachnospiraceae bacterium]|nr:BMP family ABC transporter substrate-binding protein [Lachnospiraceae bacterium]